MYLLLQDNGITCFVSKRDMSTILVLGFKNLRIAVVILFFFSQIYLNNYSYKLYEEY